MGVQCNARPVTPFTPHLHITLSLPPPTSPMLHVHPHITIPSTILTLPFPTPCFHITPVTLPSHMSHSHPPGYTLICHVIFSPHMSRSHPPCHNLPPNVTLLRTLCHTYPQVRDQVMDWMCDREMNIYQMFSSQTMDVSKLDRFERRFHWWVMFLHEGFCMAVSAWQFHRFGNGSLCNCFPSACVGSRIAHAQRETVS